MADDCMQRVAVSCSTGLRMQTLLEIRYLIAAVFLAEDLSFTRAAKRLKLSQSGLSRRLNELESRCGCKLFTRNHAHVAITDAGRAFVEEAKLSLVHHERAMQSAKTAHAGVVSHLTIGHSPYVDPVLTSTLFSIRLPLHPNLLLNMQSDFAPELVHGLLTSKLDLALIANPGANRKLTMIKIAEAPFYVAFPDDHPLAARETLTLEDMRGCTWIIFDRKVHPILHDMISRRAAEDGIIYKNNQNVLTAEEAFQLVSENVGIAFLTMASALRTKSPGVTVRALVDKELRIELYLASRAENRSKLASEFVRAFMKRVEQVLAPPQMILPLSDSPPIPNERMAAKHRPKSERGIGTKPDARQAGSRRTKS
jgi:DNA-binding transcriptional LysR family regulator